MALVPDWPSSCTEISALWRHNPCFLFWDNIAWAQVTASAFVHNFRGGVFPSALLQLRNEVLLFGTAKDFMTIEVMKFSVNSILGLFVKFRGHQFSDQALDVYLFADNHGAHTYSDILRLPEWTGIVPSVFHGTVTFCNPWIWWFVERSKNTMAFLKSRCKAAAIRQHYVSTETLG
jgi:hypothetical protein